MCSTSVKYVERSTDSLTELDLQCWYSMENTGILEYLNWSLFLKQIYNCSDTQVVESQLFQLAWEKQMYNSRLAESFDVAKEAVEKLEKQMFECSSRAGNAGNYQWGLYAGPHQTGWEPYMSVPFEWDDGTYVAESENELHICHLFMLLFGSLSTRKGRLIGMI